jgi:hypothetical protein
VILTSGIHRNLLWCVVSEGEQLNTHNFKLPHKWNQYTNNITVCMHCSVSGQLFLYSDHVIFSKYLNKLALVVTHLTCIWDMPSLNISQVANYLNWRFPWFSTVPPGRFWGRTSSSSAILPFEILRVSVNKRQIRNHNYHFTLGLDFAYYTCIKTENLQFHSFVFVVLQTSSWRWEQCK